MVISVSPAEFIGFFTDFVKTGKIMFNFRWLGNGLDIQLISDFSVNTFVPAELISGTPIDVESSYYINNSIHLFNDTDRIEIEFKDGLADIRQNEVSYSIIEEYEGRRESVPFNSDEMDKLPVGRLQYLMMSAKKMVPIAKELKKLAVDVMVSNGHFYNMYSNIVFLDEVSLPDFCVPYDVMNNIVFKLKARDAKFCVKNDQLIFVSGRYTFYISLTNYNLSGNQTNMVDDIILKSKKVSEITFINVKEKAQLVLKVLKDQDFCFSISKDSLYMSVASSDNAANVSLGTPINQPIATVYLTSAQVSALLDLFGDDEKVEVFLHDKAIRFVVGTKNLIIAALVY